MSRSASTEPEPLGGLAKTLLVETLAPLALLFRKRPRDSSGLELELEAAPKRRCSDAQRLEQRERELDAALPEELRKFRPRGYPFNKPPSNRPIRIYADGVFDLFHLGHMRQLEQAKKLFPNVQLVCGIPSDAETHKRKGLTVLTDQQRADTLKHCRWVDEVIQDAPWCVLPEFLKAHDIDYVAHDDLPYALADLDDIYKPIKEQGMFLTTQRTEGILTLDIITKVIRDYDKYLMRNFARGATRKELNVLWLKKNELEFKKHISDFRTYWARNKTQLNNVLKDLYFEVREYLRGRHDEDRAASPLTEFAARYMGNNNDRRSIFDNFRDWIGNEDSDRSDRSDMDRDEQRPKRRRK